MNPQSGSHAIIDYEWPALKTVVAFLVVFKQPSLLRITLFNFNVHQGCVHFDQMMYLYIKGGKGVSE